LRDQYIYFNSNSGASLIDRRRISAQARFSVRILGF
jgi:hypothetical protein